MSVESVVEQLQDLGMSGYEAKAKYSGVPRSTVYEIRMAKLVGRGRGLRAWSQAGDVRGGAR